MGSAEIGELAEFGNVGRPGRGGMAARLANRSGVTDAEESALEHGDGSGESAEVGDGG